MSTQTTNLGLTKPAGNEKPLVSVLNANSDILDAAIGDVDVSTDGSLQEQVTALGESVYQIDRFTFNDSDSRFKVSSVEFGSNTETWSIVIVNDRTGNKVQLNIDSSGLYFYVNGTQKWHK